MEDFAELGLLGVFVMSFLAATILPIGSETVVSAVLLSGVEFWSVIIVATIGNTLGGMTGYYLGYLGKWEWLEKYFKIKREKIDVFQQRIQKYGNWIALFCWAPAVGDFIAIGLGFFKANWKMVAVYMLLGKFLRFLVWSYLTVWVLQEVQ